MKRRGLNSFLKFSYEGEDAYDVICGIDDDVKEADTSQMSMAITASVSKSVEEGNVHIPKITDIIVD